MRRLLKSGGLSEDAIHKSIMQWVSYQRDLKGLVIHYPAEGERTPSFGRRMKEYGMIKGVSDLFITMMRHGYGGAWIELKSAKGPVQPHQKEFLEAMDAQGYYTDVARSIDEAIFLIHWYTGYGVPWNPNYTRGESRYK